MKIKVVITKELEDFWGAEEDLAAMSDDEIIQLCHEDTSALIDGAQWGVKRTRKPKVNLAENVFCRVKQSGIIMEASDGRKWEHQIGGMFMSQRSTVGEFASIIAVRGEAGNYCPTCGNQVFRPDFDDQAFHDIFCMVDSPDVDDSVMDIIDKELLVQVSSRVKVDRSRKLEITEAWIPVLVDGRKGIFVYENCD